MEPRVPPHTVDRHPDGTDGDPGLPGPGAPQDAAHAVNTPDTPESAGGAGPTARPLEGTGLDPLSARRLGPLFLHRETYRRRRVMDAARLLPLFGTALMLFPALWEDSHTTSSGVVYLFLSWLGLIVVAAILSHRLSE
ncbi:MAG: hypothetical protein AAFR47_15285, partial [Pseudomonadota bacterium]